MEIFLCILVILLIIIAIYFRSTKIVIEIVGNIVVWIEENLKTASGKEKLNYAVAKSREKLPSYISIFITQKNLIRIIEFILKIVKRGFGLDNQIKINYEVPLPTTVGIELEQEKSDNGLTIYGNVKANTDFHGKNNASVEVGFKKRF